MLYKNKIFFFLRLLIDFYFTVVCHIDKTSLRHKCLKHVCHAYSITLSLKMKSVVLSGHNTKRILI